MDFLVIDDDKIFRDATCLLIEEEGHYAQPAGNAASALALLKDERFDACLLDVCLGPDTGLNLLPELLRVAPQLPVALFTAQGSVETAVEAMRRGAADFLEKPFTREQFHHVLARLTRFHQLRRNIERLEREVKETKLQNPELILDFETPQLRKIMATLKLAATTPASVLLMGESGTGKSALARVVHQSSHLAEKPFVTVSCPTLSRELLESELFGHVRGSFTGAVRDHWGKLKSAEGGTLFLDEIGELPMEIQPKLLRLLQEREYERLGENVTRHANVRIIAASNCDLAMRVTQGRFRQDLYFRLNVISVEMPPLRERPTDLQRLADHYLTHFAGECGRTFHGFSEEARARLRSYEWPGNLRELRNAIERTVILARNETIGPEDLFLEPPKPAEEAAPAPAEAPGDLVSLKTLEDRHIRRVLERTTNITEAARVLGIDQATLYRRRKKWAADASAPTDPNGANNPAPQSNIGPQSMGPQNNLNPQKNVGPLCPAA